MEEPPFGVLLRTSGDRGLGLVRAVCSVTGLSVWRSNQLLEAGPTTVVDETEFEVAAKPAGLLNAADAGADLVCRWCERVMSPEDCPVDPGPCSSPSMAPTGCPASRARS